MSDLTVTAADFRAAVKVVRAGMWGWVHCSDEEWARVSNKEVPVYSFDGAGLFRLVGKTIYRAQYGYTSKLCCKSRGFALEIWRFLGEFSS